MYDRIVNPKTGRNVSIYNKLGQNILKKYIAFGGASKKDSLNNSIPKLCDSNGNISLIESTPSEIATIILSTIFRAFLITSMWPKVMGSNVPG